MDYRSQTGNISRQVKQQRFRPGKRTWQRTRGSGHQEQPISQAKSSSKIHQGDSTCRQGITKKKRADLKKER